MRFADKELSINDIEEIKQKYGNYVKITVDIEKKILVAGCELHADGEIVLLEKGSSQDYIWGGGVDFISKTIDATAVLNLRPKLNNTSMEILNLERREKFMETTKFIFKALWRK